MTEFLRFHPFVPLDLADAISWYEEINPNIAVIVQLFRSKKV